MTVSRWERGLLAPSAEHYVQLGKLAGRGECWFFWGQSGLQLGDVLPMLPNNSEADAQSTPDVLERAHAGAGRNRSVLVSLPLLKATAGTHGNGGAKVLSLDRSVTTGIMTAPAEWCPNPNYTSLLRVKGNSMEPLIRDGDILAVDSLQTDRSELGGKVVVSTSQSNGLCVSRLRRYESLDVLESENHKYDSIVLGKSSGWRILGKVLWWISEGP